MALNSYGHCLHGLEVFVFDLMTTLDIGMALSSYGHS
jgi:hypothetical protein